MLAGRVVIGCLAAFWGLVLLVGVENPGYSQTRDYVSTLAARGAAFGWLGVLAICAVAAAMLGTALLLRPLSVVAAYSLVSQRIAFFLVVAYTRLDCPDGPARCGLRGPLRCLRVPRDHALDGDFSLGWVPDRGDGLVRGQADTRRRARAGG